MPDTPPITSSDPITLSDIAALAGGVTAPAVANWRTRFADFPAPIQKTGRTLLFDKDAVVAWLTANNKLGSADDLVNADVWQFLNQLRDQGNTFGPDELLNLITNPGNTNDNDAAFRTIYRNFVATHGERDVVEALLQRITRSAGRTHAEYDTSPELLRLIAAISDTPDNATLYDPCVGYGSTLAAIATPTSRLWGQDINTTASAIAAARLTASGYAATIATGDTTSNEQLPDVLADRVIAAPPFNLRLDDNHIDRADPRWTVEVPTRQQSNSAFIQIVLAHLNDRGRAVLHLPPRSLWDRSTIREYLVRNNLLDAVIALPPSSTPGTHIPSVLLIIDRDRPRSTPTQQTPVLIIDELDGHPNGLPASYITELIDIWEQWDHTTINHPKALTITLGDIANNDFDLTPRRYIADHDFDWPRNNTADAIAALNTNLAATVNTITVPHIDNLTISGTTQLAALKDLALTDFRGDISPKAGIGDVLTPRDIADQTPIWEELDTPHSSHWDNTTAVTGDILVALRTANTTSRVGRVTPEWHGRHISRDVLILRAPYDLDLPPIIASYLYFWLMSPAFHHHLAIHAAGATAHSVSRKDVMAYQLPKPDIGTQLKVTQHLEHALHADHTLATTLTNAQQLVTERTALTIEHIAAQLLDNAQ